VAWLLSITGSLGLAALIRIVAPDLPTPQLPDLPPAVLLFLLVVFAPVVETLIMAAVLELLLRLRVTPAVAVLLSTAGWALAHSLQAAAWGLAIWWPFLIFSTLYVVWRQRSFAAGIAVPIAAHALQNLLPGLLIAFGAEA
jgi:membrane protease YdiL (CAAX protease family)